MADQTFSQTTMRMANKVVIVTGAARGIGAAVAHRCASEGSAVVLVDRDEAALSQTLNDLREKIDPEQLKATMIIGDITEKQTILSAFGTAAEQYGGLDGLVNNAGIFGEYSRFEENDDNTFDQMVSINVRPAWQAIKLAIPMMRQRGGGAIVNIASMAAMRANRGLSLYGMTKGAIANLTINAATELAKDNIRVNAICPGPIDTDMLGQVESFIDERHSEKAQSRITQTIPMGRYGKPQEIASVAAFLLSEDAAFVTGILMPVDGGQSLE